MAPTVYPKKPDLELPLKDASLMESGHHSGLHGQPFQQSDYVSNGPNF